MLETGDIGFQVDISSEFATHYTGGRGGYRSKRKQFNKTANGVIFVTKSNVQDIHFAKDEFNRLYHMNEFQSKPFLIFIYNQNESETNLTCDEFQKLDEIKDRAIQIQPFNVTNEKCEFIWEE